jgi:hypothetical protein
VNAYAEATKALREAIEDYIDAAAWELHGKMPALDAVDIAKATARKAVDVISAEASQRLAGHIQVPDDLAGIFEKNGGVLVARIRTIKPEFWDSPDVADASAVARLLFIAMWNWADDAGRGSANLKELEGFAFPNDDVNELSGGKCRSFRHALAEVRDCFGVLFYKVRGRPFYEIPSWRKHQRNERVAKGKFPPSSEGETWDFMSPDQGRGGTSDTLRRDEAEDDGNSSEEFGSSGTGTGEQGNRGTGEQGAEEADASSSSETASPPRPEILKLCQHLKDRMVGNGCKPPTIGKKWLDDARLLLDTDKRDFDEAMALIDWCQDHHFWRSNIKSMPKFREKYDTLRLQRQDQGKTVNSNRGPDWRDVSNQNHSAWTKGNQ